MQQKTITYLSKAGLKECPACLTAAAARAKELGLAHAVVASSSGRTALELAKALRKVGSDAAVIGVAYAANYAKMWGAPLARYVRPAEKLGVRMISGTHAFGGVNAAVRDQFGAATPTGLISQTYSTFGQGMKVAVEVAVMAADQGLLPVSREVLALGGTSEGADTAVVLTPACAGEFFKVRIHEVVCMPRRRG
jgi:hypothetical protein